MPKDGLSYRSLSECLKGARAKGLPESSCDVLKKPNSGGGDMPPPPDGGTRGQNRKKHDVYPGPDKKKALRKSNY
mgnify:CR=1 FL=1